MSKELSKLLDQYIASKEDVFAAESNPEEREKLKNAVKESLEKKIYNEIKNEVRDKAIADAENEINKRADRKRISEYKSLTITGIVMAFFVGLLVNQITDIIGIYKGTVLQEKLGCTLIISIVLLLICIAIAIGLFISEIIKILERDNDERHNSRKDI